MAARISLAAQISEVEYELKQRLRVYPRIAAKEPRRTSELELHQERILAVLATLRWLQENETEVCAFVEAKRLKAAS
jgi:hypothetical protein